MSEYNFRTFLGYSLTTLTILGMSSAKNRQHEPQQFEPQVTSSLVILAAQMEKQGVVGWSQRKVIS